MRQFRLDSLETFFQKPITNGCMSCHNVTRPDTDFLWSLRMRAWSDPTDRGARERRDLRLQQLEDLLKRGLDAKDADEGR